MLNNPWMLGGNPMGQMSNSVGNPALDGMGGSGHMVVQTQSVSISSSDGSVIHQTNTYESWVTVSSPQQIGMDMVPSVAGQNVFGSLDVGSGATRGSETYLAVPMASDPIGHTSALAVSIQSPYVPQNHVEPIVTLPTQMAVSESPLVTPSETFIALPVSSSCDPLVAVPSLQSLYNPLVSVSSESQVPLIHTTSSTQAAQSNLPSWYLVVQDLPESPQQFACGAETAMVSQSEGKLHHCMKCHSAFEKLSCFEWHLRDCRGTPNHQENAASPSTCEIGSTTALEIQTIQCSACRRLFNVLEDVRSPFICADCTERSMQFSEALEAQQRQRWRCSECHEQFEFESALDEHIGSHKSTVTICELPDNYVEENGNEDDDCTVMIEPPEDNEESESCVSGSSDEGEDEASSYENCSECGHSFQCGEVLDTHLKSHDNIRSYGCTKCGVICVGKYNLGKHIWVHNREDEEKELADSCFDEQEEDTKDGLVIKPFGCTECGMHFSDSSELKEHCMTHLRAKPFACTQCGEKFETTSSLERHWEAHSCVMA